MLNQITMNPLPEPTGFAYHYEKHYNNYGRLHYTATRHFYAQSESDLEVAIHFWDEMMNPAPADSRKADKDTEDGESRRHRTGGAYCTIPRGDSDDWNDSDDDYYDRILAAQAAV